MLQARIKGSRLYTDEKSGTMRVYIPYIRQRNGKHIGMDGDELLRLKQISGLSELFHNKEFSQAYDMER